MTTEDCKTLAKQHFLEFSNSVNQRKESHLPLAHSATDCFPTWYLSVVPLDGVVIELFASGRNVATDGELLSLEKQPLITWCLMEQQ